MSKVLIQLGVYGATVGVSLRNGKCNSKHKHLLDVWAYFLMLCCAVLFVRRSRSGGAADEGAAGAAAAAADADPAARFARLGAISVSG